MLKISRHRSVTLSLILTVLFMLALIGGAVIMPRLADTLIATQDHIDFRDHITAAGRIFVLAVAYGILAMGAVADTLLFCLLLRVRKGLVFTDRSVALIRAVSWCGILLGLLFALLGVYFQLSFAVAFAGFFLGLCVRVVKNVIEEAIAIKQENDLTV
ncbi:MAG: DUF2975 domain-containing protein [Clostridia bacterium]|nr:DUF2975 domain-containing protein [Clostridia bacterium]